MKEINVKEFCGSQIKLIVYVAHQSDMSIQYERLNLISGLKILQRNEKLSLESTH